MKRLDEILSKSRSAASSAATSATSPATAERSPAGRLPGLRRRRLRPPCAAPVDHPRFGKAEPCDCVLDEDGGRPPHPPGAASATSARSRASPSRPSSLPDVAAKATGSGVRSRPPAQYAESTRGLARPRRAERQRQDAPRGRHRQRAHRRWRARRSSWSSRTCSTTSAPATTPSDDDLGFDQLFDQVRNAPLLILDDIDAATRHALGQGEAAPGGQPPLQRSGCRPCSPRQPRSRSSSMTGSPPASATRHCPASLSSMAPDAAATRQVGGMTRERLAEMQFRNFDLRGAGLRAGRARVARCRLPRRHGLRRRPARLARPPGRERLRQDAPRRGHRQPRARRRQGVFFAVVPDLLDHLRASFAPGQGGALRRALRAGPQRRPARPR